MTTPTHSTTTPTCVADHSDLAWSEWSGLCDQAIMTTNMSLFKKQKGLSLFLKS